MGHTVTASIEATKVLTATTEDALTVNQLMVFRKVGIHKRKLPNPHKQ